MSTGSQRPAAQAKCRSTNHRPVTPGAILAATKATFFETRPDEQGTKAVRLVNYALNHIEPAQEFGQDGGSARGWADKTIGKRVTFSADKRRFIYQMIEELDRQLTANP